MHRTAWAVPLASSTYIWYLEGARSPIWDGLTRMVFCLMELPWQYAGQVRGVSVHTSSEILSVHDCRALILQNSLNRDGKWADGLWQVQTTCIFCSFVCFDANCRDFSIWRKSFCGLGHLAWSSSSLLSCSWKLWRVIYVNGSNTK